jgi:hypothetical protein
VRSLRNMLMCQCMETERMLQEGRVWSGFKVECEHCAVYRSCHKGGSYDGGRVDSRKRIK